MPDARRAVSAHPRCIVLLLHPPHAPAGVYVAAPVRIRDRLLARLRARRLAASLAGGGHPEADAALALRPHELTSLCHRRDLAGGLERVAAPVQGRRLA